MEQIKEFPNHGARQLFPSNGKHAVSDNNLCKVSRRNLEQANDRLTRANRDLGETAGFIAASLTTVTAAEAVINIAVQQINLSVNILRVAFDVYIALFLIIFLWGAIRAQAALHKRARAEREIDQAKRGIFEHCSEEPSPKPKEE